MSRPQRWEVSISIEPHVVTVYCPEDDIRKYVTDKLIEKHGFTPTSDFDFEIEDTVNLTELRKAS